MSINKNNYETFVIDFLEGNLSEELTYEFKLFLENNLDIYEEIANLNEAILPKENLIFVNKDLLKKNVNQELEKIDLLLAKNLEGDLNPKEKDQVEKLLIDNDYAKKSWSLIQKTILAPEVFSTQNFTPLKFPDSIDYSVEDHLLIGKIEGDLNDFQNAAANELIGKDQELFGYLKMTKIQADEDVIYPHKQALKKTAIIPLWKKMIPVITIAAMILLGFLFFNDSNKTEIARTIDERVDQNTKRSVVIQPNEKNLVEQQPLESLDQKNNDKKERSYKAIPEKFDQTPNANMAKMDKPGQKEIEYKKMPTPEPMQSIAYHLVDNPIDEKSIESQPIHVIEPNRIHDQENLADNNYKSFRDFATETAKKALWGDEAYPQENYTAALIEKTVHKVEVLDNSLPEVSMDDAGWEFRFKKFSVQRKKS